MRQNLIFVSLACLLSTTAFAQAETKASADEAKAAMEAAAKAAAEGKEAKDGWDIGAKVGGTGSFLQNNNFVGQADGATIQFGALLAGKANLVAGDIDWQNSLSIEHAQLKSPNIDSFIKSADALELKSLLLYHIPGVSWVGPYARARAFAQIFPGSFISDAPQTVIRTNADGSVATSAEAAQKPIALTNFFEPLVLEQAVGVFFEPIKEKLVTINAKVGMGSQQVITQGGHTLTDNPDTAPIELTQLSNVISVGAEAGAEARGIIIDEVLSWNANLGLYYPFFNTSPVELEAGDLLHITAGGGLSLKLAKWVSVDYALKVIKQPFVLNDFQIQNAILITTGFDLL